jgi:hypothetical protein
MKTIMRLSLAAALLGAGACATFGGPDELHLRTEPRFYSPAMSSTIGIGLTPLFAAPGGAPFVYHWHTDFGYFVNWAASGKVAPLGPEADSGDGTLYWTYDSQLALDHKPTVTIVVEATSPERGDAAHLYARKKIKLDWDRDTAHVRDE